jgi:hypothetical protein
MREQKQQLPSNTEKFLILQCSVAPEKDLKNVDPASVITFFEKAKAKETDHEVQEMVMPVVCDQTEVTTSSQVSAVVSTC